MQPLNLHPDRFFDPDPTIRAYARQLYEEVHELPIVGPHGHVDPEILAHNHPFPEPTSLILIPDHYIFRMLYSQGVRLEDLGIPRIDGAPVETDMRKIWQRFGDHYYLFAGTPTGAWIDHEFYKVFGVRYRLDSDSAMYIYDELSEKLASEEFLPRALFDRFNIEVLTTTDAATDSLEAHDAIRSSDWNGTVLPCFRPDALLKIALPEWSAAIDKLGERFGSTITSFDTYLKAIEDRRAFFRSMGAVSTDHAVLRPYTHALPADECERLFQQARNGAATAADQDAFEAHMLMEMARMSTEDGMVMQIHPGSFRNHNQWIYKHFGPDKGADIPIRTEYTRNMKELLNAYGNDPDFTLVLFTLDESTYSRELAPLAGHYPSLRLGPAWWFFDSFDGMMRNREMITETAGIYNTAGFNDDTRAFPSIPARHDLSRRVDANYLARLVAHHYIDIDLARRMSRIMVYELVKDTYRL